MKRIVGLRVIFVLAVFVMSSCSVSSVATEHCESPGIDVVRVWVKNALIAEQHWDTPNWNAIEKESLKVDEVRIWYIATFKTMPIGLVDVIFDCEGQSRRIRVNKWNELSQNYQ